MAHVRIFRHYIHLPYIIMGAADLVVLGVVFYCGVFFRYFGEINFFLDNYQVAFPEALTFAAVNLIIMIAMGVYPAKTQEGMSGMMLRTIFSILMSAAGLSFLFYVTESWLWYFGKGVLALSSVLAIFILGISRSLFLFFANEQSFKRNVLVLGAGNRASNLYEDLKEPLDRRGVELMGFVPGLDEEVKVPHQKVLTIPGTLKEYVLQHPVDEIVIALDDRRKKLPLDDLLECKMEGVHIVDAPTFLEREGRKVALDLIQPSWMIFADGFGAVSTRSITKRGFDILSSLSLLLVTWPIMLLTVLAIKLEEGWSAPVLYKQERVGLNGQPFPVMKFRSMRVDAEKHGAVWAQKNDTRVTRIGGFIRKVRIDELPQIFNVLLGDMAVVGPRPERPIFVEKLSEKIPYYNERHRVKPGITGWAQLCFAYADSEEDTKEKLRYDLYYIKNQSLLLDLIVLIQTVEVILFKKGSR
ncbi:TIGR03013 family PEP-CTERM/XrtA system glycosyltransferase [Hahella sp. KA22]|uniref:TIGR03013 family XrtA/PEP-CTERM system glycosyltransferase n=1 Tax=Hahella sp. KA22 TaxID=1628392 RepID=UPI000FDE0035|nr:TIGR03013 family XrtA/PEP-CTERM system glycosyltransferase [Hahella sp. KA22]AZZ93007.1 TIGR03013 family PEP-CTERM/XrtA system glycosyltransferase [Hahella sp. KA22]QAY56382.1 TIGR03013 family PEP-CTERM/XrtA system glycosyltransferase [Hahella sp. KA22]